MKWGGLAYECQAVLISLAACDCEWREGLDSVLKFSELVSTMYRAFLLSQEEARRGPICLRVIEKDV